MPDQAQKAGGEAASVSPEVADYFGVKDQAPEASGEKVTSDDSEKQAVVADKTKENTSESKGKAQEPIPTEEKKTTVTEKVKGKDEKTPKKEDTEKKEKEEEETSKPVVFEVAGTKYDKVEDAIKAVNKINGDNSRLVGDNKQAKEKLSAAEEKNATLSKLLEDYKAANEQWQKYYEEGGEKPDETKVNIEEAITKVLEKQEKSKSEKAIQKQFSDELDEIFNFEDFEKVQPFFKELVAEQPDPPKVSPKKLFERARILFKNSLPESNLKDADDINELIEESATKKLRNKEAAKALPASGGSSGKVESEEKLSPEIADYFKNR